MEVLARLPDVSLWKIDGNGRQRIAEGQWSLVSTGTSVLSVAGGVQWRLTAEMACLRTEKKSFVFAINPPKEEYYCITARDGVTDDELKVIETVLECFCLYKVSESLEQGARSLPGTQGGQEIVAPGQSKTDKMVEGVGKATAAAVRGLQASSEFLSRKIIQGGTAVKNNTAACTEPKPVSDTTKKRVEHVKQLSKGAAFVAHAAMEVVADITAKVAEVVVDAVKSRSDEPKDKPPSAVKRVGASMLVAAAEVWDAMEDAFKLVAKSSATTTADVIGHKYGAEAGLVSYDGMSAVGHVADTAYVARRLGPKVVAKSAAKKVATGVVVGNPANAAQGGSGSITSQSGQGTIAYPQVAKPLPQ